MQERSPIPLTTTLKMKIKVLDLFSGLGGWSNCWREAGHEVETLDLDPRFGATWCQSAVDFSAANGATACPSPRHAAGLHRT